MTSVKGACPQCGKPYTDKFNLTHHVIWLHEDMSRCLKCHHPTPADCEMCGTVPDVENILSVLLVASGDYPREEAMDIIKLGGMLSFWDGPPEKVMQTHLRLLEGCVHASEEDKSAWEVARLDFEKRKELMSRRPRS